MSWAFWRRDDAQEDTRAGAAAGRDPAERADPAAVLKVRARRRLVGAAALLLAAVIVVPMVLDPAPRPVADNIPIEIPGEKTPFLPRLPLPPDPALVQSGPPPDASAPAPDAKADAPAADKAGMKAAAGADDKTPPRTTSKPEAKLADASAAKAAASAAPREDDGRRAREILEGRSAELADRYVLQVAALGSEKAAAELAARLKKEGHPVFTERVQVKDGPRWRVRIGPYASRAEADKARARLRDDGVTANLVPPAK